MNIMDDNGNDADSVSTASSNPNASNRSNLKRKHVFMALLLLYNHQFIVQLLMMSGALPVFLPMKKKFYTGKRKHNSHRDHRAVIDFIHSWSDTMF